MADAQYISVREAANILNVTEKTIMDLIDKGDLQAYKIANQFLRLKKGEVMNLQKGGDVETETVEFPYTPAERLRDFLYYNDFYLLSVVLVGILLALIFQS
ncbi:MAG: helix-turn-helix domain-containing protein [Candidatus Omnitrophota bacterium]